MLSHCAARIEVAGCGYLVRAVWPMTRGRATATCEAGKREGKLDKPAWNASVLILNYN